MTCKLNEQKSTRSANYAKIKGSYEGFKRETAKRTKFNKAAPTQQMRWGAGAYKMTKKTTFSRKLLAIAGEKIEGYMLIRFGIGCG